MLLTRQRPAGLGVEAVGATAEQFDEAVRGEIREYRKLVKTTAMRDN